MGGAHSASIIISSYNYERFLREAIDSALNQTYPSAEVIVVDDGSTDNSADVIADFGDRVVKVLKGNGGQASAFNAGFAVSRGEVVIFLDSDDLLEPTAVETALTLFDRPEVVKVHWPLWSIDKIGRRSGRKVPVHPLSEGDLRETNIRGGPGSYIWPPTSGNAWARRFIADIFPMPEPEFKTCPDLYLSTLAPLFGTIRTADQPQGSWRVHGENNTWRDPFDRRIEKLIQRWDHCFRTLKDYCDSLGIAADPEIWRANTWYFKIHQAIRELQGIIPPAEPFILVDQDQWETDEFIAGRRRLHFPEREGKYWGLPADDAEAIDELEKLRGSGLRFMVFAWPSFWWLSHYLGLRRHLDDNFRRALENERLIVFDLE